MRKFLLVILFLTGVTFTYAQKGRVTQAISYFTSGKLDEAKKLIDEAIKSDNCINWDKAHYTKGQIYQAIYESPVGDYRKLSDNALEIAWTAYQQVIKLDEKRKYDRKLETQYRNLFVDYTNLGVENYNAQNYKGALSAFKRVLEIEKSSYFPTILDTALIFNTALAAQKVGELNEAEKYYKEALKFNYEPARTYAMLSNVLRLQGKDDEAIIYLKRGYEMFPDNSYMTKELINYYLFGREPEKAEVYLDAAIREYPSDGSLYRAKALFYEKTNQRAEAEEMYNKALSIDPQDFISLFNLGNVKLNTISEDAQRVQDIIDVNEYNKGMRRIQKSYIEVLPYFEKALELKPDDKSTIGVLKDIYFRLRNESLEYMRKYEEMKNILENQ